MLQVQDYAVNFNREPLLAPFGFKGGYVDEIWHSRVRLTGSGGASYTGRGVQSVLWSDSGLFSCFSAAGGNALMLLVSEYCAKRYTTRPCEDPLSMFDAVYSDVYEYAKRLTGFSALRPTFALNAMVPADNALWLLHAAENGIRTFDELIPKSCLAPFSARHGKLAAIPLITYDTPLEEVRGLAVSGCSIFKIKIGSDPGKNGDAQKMLEWDMARLREIHSVLREYTTPYVSTGRLAYYLDANGRYDTPDRVLRLLDFADSIGALNQVVLLEEPFPENSGIDVSSLPVAVAADESAHTDTDVEALAGLGYRAVALKPIAKTMSMSFKIAAAAARQGIPCFCADLTVDPLLVDFNKCFAARLSPIPGMNIGVLESNGAQNYARWPDMIQEHPVPDGDWIPVTDGLFHLSERFYQLSGGILGADT